MAKLASIKEEDEKSRNKQSKQEEKNQEKYTEGEKPKEKEPKVMDGNLSEGLDINKRSAYFTLVVVVWLG